MTKKMRISIPGLLLLYAFLIIVLIIALFPIVYAIFGSFKPNAEFVAGGSRLLPKEWRFENFKEAWELANFARYTWNSVFVTAISVVGILFLNSMAGYVFDRADFPGKKLLLGSFLATMFISTGSITLYPILQVTKLIGANKSLWGLIIVYVFGVNVTNVYLFMGYVRSLPKELDEAATIDGCGFFGIYWRIIIPLSKPILATIALLTFKATWNDYMMPLVFTMSNEKIRTLTVGVVALQNTKDGAAAWNIMLAGTTISLIPIILVYIFTNQYFISGITAGAIKA
ncbi:MAG: hypothetical protein PWP48_1006 [Clostridiales bacterium]|nr:hypothetical protein [Clostridiales bacterium]